MIRSNPYNMAKIYEQGRADAGKGKMNEKKSWTVSQYQEYLEGWYSIKAPHGSIAADTTHSNLDLY